MFSIGREVPAPLDPHLENFDELSEDSTASSSQQPQSQNPFNPHYTSSAYSEHNGSDTSTVIDFEYCRAGAFERPPGSEGSEADADDERSLAGRVSQKITAKYRE